MFDPLRSDAPLIVYVDIKSPYAFIARGPTRAMAAAVGIDVDWRPLTLDIPSYLGSARLDGRGKVAESQRTPQQWSAVRYAYRDARRYAELQGLTLRGTEKIWDTSLVHIAFDWVRTRARARLDDFLDDVYARFWRRELDVEDVQVVSDALTRAGVDVEGFETHARSAGRERHAIEQRAIFDAGIFGVPSYVVEGELYFGREHLPTVRWILEGRRGPHPDVANEAPGARAGTR